MARTWRNAAVCSRTCWVRDVILVYVLVMSCVFDVVLKRMKDGMDLAKCCGVFMNLLGL